MKWMLDTDTCIALIKRKPPELIKRLQAKAVGDIGISSITLAELRFGAANSRRQGQNRTALDQFLLPLDIVAFDELAADCYGSVRAELEVRATTHWSDRHVDCQSRVEPQCRARHALNSNE